MSASKRSVVLALAPLLFGLYAFPQAGIPSIDHAKQLGEEAMRLVREKQVFAVRACNILEYSADPAASSAQEADARQIFDLGAHEPPAMLGNEPANDAAIQPGERLRVTKPPDRNRDIYYRNKLEFSLDGGWLPLNVPFPLDVFVGDV